MAHNTRVRVDADWVTTVLGSELRALDTGQFESINGDQGGTWAPAALIIIGGAGLQVTGPLTIDDLQNSHITNGHALTVDSGAYIHIASGGNVNVQGAGGFTVDAAGTGQINGYLYVANAGYIEVQSGGVINTLSGGNVNLQTGSQLRVYAGGSLQVDGTETVSSGGALTVQNGATLTVEGAGNWPQLTSQSEWVPCMPCYSFAVPSQWEDALGAGFEVQAASAQEMYCRTAVPEHVTVGQVQVRWKGPAHGTWPPQNLTTFSAYQVDINGSKNLLATQADTSAQVTYEANHALTIDFSGTPTDFTPGEYLLVVMVTESGTNAVAGSLWVSTQMYITFSSLQTAGAA